MGRSRLGIAELFLAALAGALVTFVGGEAIRTAMRERRKAEEAAATARARRDMAQQLASTRADHAGANGPTAPRAVQSVGDLEAVRARLAVGTKGTYIADLIESQDSVLYRWSERTVETLRVWVQSSSMVKHWRHEFVVQARDAFGEWGEAGFPVRFTFTLDSSSADVRVMWIDHFPARDGQRVGRADRQVDASGWIRHADLFVAVHDSAGRPIPPEWVAAIARHEVGHALGLGHTRDTASIMYPTSRTAVIGPADRATLRFLYTLPPGSLRAGR
jgi:predicted Zn-dependent protease